MIKYICIVLLSVSFYGCTNQKTNEDVVDRKKSANPVHIIY